MDLIGALTFEPQSGQTIAAHLGVSRAAVSKAAKALQQRGYPIVVDHGAGYSLPPGSPTPSAFATVRSGALGERYEYVGRTSSTQDLTRTLAAEGALSGTVVLAETQEAGRGRRGRTWESIPGSSLTFSVLLRPAIPVSSLGLLSLAAGVALADAVGDGATVRWPNDLLAADGRKLAGVLAESQTSAEEVVAVIVGIGINVHGPAPAGGVAVDERDPAVRRVDLLAGILDHLEHWVGVAIADPDALTNAWCSRTTMIDAQVEAATAAGTIRGIAEGLDATGALLIRSDGTTVPVHAGDVIQMTKETT